MKQSILILFLFFGCLSYSQSIVKSSIDVGGASVNNGNVQVLFTIGETLVREINVGNIIISEGFINNAESSELNIHENSWLNDIIAYPNPTKGMLSIK